MGIADEIAAESRIAGGKCTVAAALAALPPAKRREFEAELAGPPDGRGNAIAKVLSRHSQLKIGGQTINRHRKGECNCGDR